MLHARHDAAGPLEAAPARRAEPTPGHPIPMAIHLQLLGNAGLDAADLPPNARARHRHPLALLAFVAAAAPAGVGRERIAAYLWPESDSERASNSLRQTLFWLRKDLGEDLFLPESGGVVQLNPKRLEVDLWELREALDGGDARAAVQIYSGPFLDGFHLPGAAEFSHWADSERQRLERRYVMALDTLARDAEADGRHEDAVAWLRRRAAVEPLSSAAAMALLRALVEAGDVPGALVYASTYESLVRLHLGVEPDPTVRELVAALRSGTAGRGSDAKTAEKTRRPGVGDADVPLPPEPAQGTRAPDDGDRLEPPPAAPRRFRLWSRYTVGTALAAALAIVAVGLLARPGTTPPALPGSTLTVLGSGLTSVGGRDPANRLISCSGPACPDGELPQQAFIIPKHTYYTDPVAGTRFIAQVPDGMFLESPGYSCCTTATFETEFSLPPEATAARISISVLADNQAAVAINGVEFGRHSDSIAPGNYGGPAQTFGTTFLPDPQGNNRLHVTLWDGGGALGLQYHAVVTYQTFLDPAPADSELSASSSGRQRER